MTRFFALAVLPCLLPTCSPAPALSQQPVPLPVPPAHGCYRLTTPQERLSGLPNYLRVLHCSQKDGQMCFYLGAEGVPSLIYSCDDYR